MKRRSNGFTSFAGTSLSETLDMSLETPKGLLCPAFAGDIFLTWNLDQKGEWEVVEPKKHTQGKRSVICTISSDN